jgi:hypothetical protein
LEYPYTIVAGGARSHEVFDSYIVKEAEWTVLFFCKEYHCFVGVFGRVSRVRGIAGRFRGTKWGRWVLVGLVRMIIWKLATVFRDWIIFCVS